MKEILEKITREINAEDESTFMYNLHYNGFFDENKFNVLLDDVEKYMDNSEIRKDNKIIAGIFELFLHTIFLCYCSETGEDSYKIKNSKPIAHDVISDYYLKMRMVVDKIKNQ